MRGADIDLGDDNHDRYIQCQRDAEVLFRHSYQPVVSSYHKQAVIWGAAQKTEYSGPQVAFMSSQISKADHFGRSCSDFAPSQLSAWHVACDNVAMCIEAHDFHANGARSAGFNFMLMAEEVYSGFATTIIKVSLHQNSEHGGFSCVDITNHSYSSFNDFLGIAWMLSYEEFASARFILLIFGFGFFGTVNIVREKDPDICSQCAGGLA